MTQVTAPVLGQSWHALGRDDVVARLGTDAESGLADEEARRRLARVGPNRVGGHPETPIWRIALAQFTSLVVMLLLAASAVAWALDERAEAVAILAALGLNAVIGFGFEWRAQISLVRLRALAVPHAMVRRGGRTLEVPSADLVPGDLIVLSAGAHVPADARLVKSTALSVSDLAKAAFTFATRSAGVPGGAKAAYQASSTRPL